MLCIDPGCCVLSPDRPSHSHLPVSCLPDSASLGQDNDNAPSTLHYSGLIIPRVAYSGFLPPPRPCHPWHCSSAPPSARKEGKESLQNPHPPRPAAGQPFLSGREARGTLDHVCSSCLFPITIGDSEFAIIFPERRGATANSSPDLPPSGVSPQPVMSVQPDGRVVS